MSLLTVDTTRCLKDGLCAKECPLGLIEMGERGPVEVEGAESRCVSCGHCVAVCPRGVLDLKTVPSSSCAPQREDWAGKPEAVASLMRGRRSIRNYRERTVDREIILRLLDPVRHAPSGINRQPVKWSFIHDQARMKEIQAATLAWMRAAVAADHPLAQRLPFEGLVAAWDAGRDRIFRSAPHLLVAYADSKDPIGAGSCLIAASYAELVAPTLGLGTCWAGYVMGVLSQAPELQRLMGVPEGHQSHAVLMLGYPRYAFRRVPTRKALDLSWV